MDAQPRRLARYLANLPYTTGYELSDQHVVIGALDSDLRTIAHSAVDWNDSPDNDYETADQVTKQLAIALRSHTVAQLIVTSYGPAGPARSQILAATLEGTFDLRPEQLHVQDGIGRIRHTTSGRWGPGVRVADVAPQAAVLGLPAPATSRDALQDSVAPLSRPLFEPLDTSRATSMRNRSPQLRADIALRALDTLAASQVDDPEQMRLLAHLITADLSTRDAVLAHAVSGGEDLMDARSKALVRTFRAAPIDQQPQLASTAAAATYLAAWHAPIVQGLLRHADKTDDLGQLVGRTVRLGLDPQPARPAIVEAAQQTPRRGRDALEHPADRPAPLRRPDSADDRHAAAPTNTSQGHTAPRSPHKRTRAVGNSEAHRGTGPVGPTTPSWQSPDPWRLDRVWQSTVADRVLWSHHEPPRRSLVRLTRPRVRWSDHRPARVHRPDGSSAT